MSRFGIIVNVDKCVGCHACAIACKEENQVAPGIFYERVERFENIADNFINWFRVSCMHCDKPACMPVCPAKAIHRGPAGEVLVDQKNALAAVCANAPARTARRNSMRLVKPITSAAKRRLPSANSSLGKGTLPAVQNTARSARIARVKAVRLPAWRPAASGP